MLQSSSPTASRGCDKSVDELTSREAIDEWLMKAREEWIGPL